MTEVETMNAILVEKYGEVGSLVHKRVKKPSAPQDYDVLVKYAGDGCVDFGWRC